MKEPRQNALNIITNFLNSRKRNTSDLNDDNILIEPRPYICVQSSTESLKKASFNEVFEHLHNETRKLSVK